MAIFITGDTHGDFSRLQPAAFHEQRNLKKDGILAASGMAAIQSSDGWTGWKPDPLPRCSLVEIT